MSLLMGLVCLAAGAAFGATVVWLLMKSALNSAVASALGW